MLIHANTLTEAVALRKRPGAISLIVSLDGARYYVFHSRQSPEQVANTLVTRKIAMHLQLVRERLAQNQDLDELAVAHSACDDSAWQDDEWNRIVPTARKIAAQRGMDDGRHAEEAMIEKWSECLADYRRLRGRSPSVAEVYLTHCPCQESDAAPSPARVLDGTLYPKSCRLELRAFCLTGTRASVRWRVYYEHPFHGRSLDETYGSLRISPLPAYIVMPPA